MAKTQLLILHFAIYNLHCVLKLVGRAGLEPTTLCLKGRYSTS